MKNETVPSPDRLPEPKETPQGAPAPDGGGAPKGGRAWQWLLAGGLLLPILYIAIPYGTIAAIVYIAASLFAAVFVAVAVYRRPRPFCPAAWILLACGLALTTFGHVIWYWLELRGFVPFPSVADVVYLAAYPLFMGALWVLGRRDGHDDGALSDALIVGVAAAVLAWALLIAPYVRDPSLTIGQLLITAAYPVADLILLPLTLHLVFLHRTRVRAHQLLLGGMLAYLAADVLFAHGNLVGWYASGGFTDGLWLVAYALFVAAVWHPSVAVEPRSRTLSAELMGRRLVILGAAVVLVPGTILLTAETSVETVRIAAIGSILLFLLVVYRLAGLLKKTRRQSEMLENLSQTDPLTGAANRRRLEDELTREVSRADRIHTPLGLAFLDLDHFKRFNDTHGHSAGDALLQELVLHWRNILRPTDVLARAGGEEFVVVFPDTEIDQCRTVVERLRAIVPYGQTCSAGIATFHPGETADAFVARADQAMYKAKNSGRDRTVLADAGTSAKPQQPENN